MDIRDAHEQILDQLDKELNGYLSPEEIDRLINRAQRAEFYELYGAPPKEVAQLRRPLTAYGASQKIIDDLAPFRRYFAFNERPYDPGANPGGTGPDGALVLPVGYVHLISLATSSEDAIPILTEAEVGNRAASSYLAPEPYRPVARQDQVGGSVNGFDVAGQYRVQFFPRVPLRGRAYFLAEPPDVRFVYTLNGREVIYDPATSVHLVWNMMACQRIINRAISLGAERLQAPEKVQYHEAKNQQGL